LRNGHLNTVYPTIFRKQEDPNYTRVTVPTRDGDFLHVDCLRQGNDRIAILCHGLEGSSQSQYVIGTSKLLNSRNWDTAALNYRGCSGVINTQPRLYHSGATEDLQDTIDHLGKGYKEIALIGYSLGGNLVLKYLGERGNEVNNNIVASATMSVPLDLGAACLHIHRWQNYIYEKRFLVSLIKKVKAKAEQFPDIIDTEHTRKIKSIYDFDDIYTSVLHGYRNADHYYKSCSSKNFVENIRVPSMIINAMDDPFLPKACYPRDLISRNNKVVFLTPKYGGHVGFVNYRQSTYWGEERIAGFLNEKSELTKLS